MKVSELIKNFLLEHVRDTGEKLETNGAKLLDMMDIALKQGAIDLVDVEGAKPTRKN
jgi:hypothetical protein